MMARDSAWICPKLNFKYIITNIATLETRSDEGYYVGYFSTEPKRIMLLFLLSSHLNVFSVSLPSVVIALAIFIS